MRILHVIIGLGTGGAELMLKRLVVSHAASSGYEHIVISLTTIGNVGEELRARGVKVEALGMRSFSGMPSVFMKLLKEIRKSRPDIVQTWMYHADFLGGIAARLAGIRQVIWGVRTTDVRAGNKAPTVAIMRLCSLLSSIVPSKIVCAADASRKSHEAEGYAAGKMAVVPNGFDIAALRTAAPLGKSMRSALGIGENELLIGTVGRFNQAKDHQNLIKAFALLANKYPESRVLMVGRGLEWSNEILKKWIAETGNDKRFLLLGERNDVPACLALLDVFCLSSCSEGFPNVVGEAMALGIPCVATKAGDAEILIGDTGFVVPTKNASLLADGLDKMLQLSSSDRLELGRRAARRIETEFTMERSLEKFEAIYSMAAKGNC